MNSNKIMLKVREEAGYRELVKRIALEYKLEIYKKKKLGKVLQFYKASGLSTSTFIKVMCGNAEEFVSLWVMYKIADYLGKSIEFRLVDK